MIALTACGISQESSEPSYRDIGIPISYSTRVDPWMITGKWYAIADFRKNRKTGCSTDWSFTLTDRSNMAIIFDCNSSGDEIGEVYTIGNGGRFVVSGRNPRRGPDLLVLWIDEEMRTMVVGQKNGAVGAILNRTPTLRADRLQAARDILQFNGYDLSQLETVTP